MKTKNQAVAVIVAFIVSVFFCIIVGSVWASFEDSVPYVEPDYGMQFTRMDVDIAWRDDRSCHIVQSMQVEFLDNGYDGYSGSHGIYVDIPVNSGEKIRDLTVTANGRYSYEGNRSMPYSVENESGFKIVRVIVGSEDSVFYKGDTMTCKVEYDYLTPVHPENKNLLDINAIGYGWMSPVVSATVTVSYPTEITGVDVQTGTQSSLNAFAKDGITVGADGKSVTVAVGALAPFNGVRVTCEMPDGLLTSSFDYMDLIPVGIGMVLLLVVVLAMVFFGKDKALTPVVNFYPPRVDGRNGEKRQMLPVQMGKIIDGTCSLEDVTSLIFYWASQGFIEIEENDSETYFIKLKELDEVTTYEKRMFDTLFAGKKRGKDGKIRVSLSSLTGRFSRSVTAVKNAVDLEYKGAFYERKYNILALVAVFLTAAYGIYVGVFCTFKVSFGYFNVAGVATLVPVILAGFLGSAISKYYFKLSASKRRASIVFLFIAVAALSVGVMFLIPTHVMDWVYKAAFAVCFSVSAALAPFLTVRTASYTESLNEIVGFRNFIRDVEKEKLEAMLEDDPQYYYNILPYANVLGVSDIWADKFKGITLEPPTYYRGHRHMTVFDVMVLHHLCRSVGHGLTYTPPSAHSGSFSGGGSSHRGGGGGFGGGGGGRW